MLSGMKEWFSLDDKLAPFLSLSASGLWCFTSGYEANSWLSSLPSCCSFLFSGYYCLTKLQAFPNSCSFKKNMLNCEVHYFTLRYFWPLLNFTPLAYSMLKSYFPLRKSFRPAWWPLHLHFKSSQGLALLFLSRKGKIMLIWRLTIFK